MSKAAIQLPDSPQMGSEVSLGHLRLISDSRLTDQSGLLLHLGFWEVKCRLGSVASSSAAAKTAEWQTAHCSRRDSCTGQPFPGKDSQILLFLLLPNSQQRVGTKNCSRMTGDAVPVADELIAGVRVRREMAEAVVVVTDQLHPPKIIPTATPTVAQLCVLTLETQHRAHPDGNS